MDLFGLSADLPATRPTRVILPDGQRLIAQHEVVALARVLTSHRPKGVDLIHRPEYPARVQFREYEGPRGAAARKVVYDAAGNIDPDQLLDPTYTTVAGPPLVAPWPITGQSNALLCVAGNQRCMLLLVAVDFSIATRRGVAAYVRALRRRVRELGMGAVVLPPG